MDYDRGQRRGGRNRGWRGPPRGRGGGGNRQKNIHSHGSAQTSNNTGFNNLLNPDQYHRNEEPPFGGVCGRFPSDFVGSPNNFDQTPYNMNSDGQGTGARRKESSHYDKRTQHNANYSNSPHIGPSHYQPEFRRDYVPPIAREPQQMFHANREQFQNFNTNLAQGYSVNPLTPTHNRGFHVSTNPLNSQEVESSGRADFAVHNKRGQFQRRHNKPKNNPNFIPDQASLNPNNPGFNPDSPTIPSWTSETNLYRGQSSESLNSEVSLNLKIHNRNSRRGKRYNNKEKSNFQRDLRSNLPNVDVKKAECDSRPLSRSSTYSNDPFNDFSNTFNPQEEQSRGAVRRVANNSKRGFQKQNHESVTDPNFIPDHPKQSLTPNNPTEVKQDYKWWSGIENEAQVARGTSWNSETNLQFGQSSGSLNSENLKIHNRNSRRGKRYNNKEKSNFQGDLRSNLPNVDMNKAECDNRPLSRSSIYSNDSSSHFNNINPSTFSDTKRVDNRTRNHRGRGRNGPDCGFRRDSRPLSRNSSCSNDDSNNLINEDQTTLPNVVHEFKQTKNCSVSECRKNGDRGNSKKKGQNAKDCKKENITNNAGKQKPNITIEQLQRLSQFEPMDIIQILSLDESEYSALLQEELEPNVFILAIDIISKICATPQSQERAELLRKASMPLFTNQLFNCVTDFPYFEDNDMLQLANMFFENAITLYETLCDFMPSAARIWHNHIVEVQKSLNTMSKNPNIELSPNLLNLAKYLLDEIGQSLKSEVKEEKVHDQNKKKETYFPEPVGDFRTVSLYPRPEDVYAEQPFLFPNITKGPYRNVEHYLDIHFKLLREDFMSPIRQGIRDYKKKCNTKDRFKRVDNVRIYRKVKFLHPKTVMDTVGYEICFDVDKKINRVNWQFSNRFMYGSLLLFTNDDFDSFFMATVANRNVKELENKLVTVELVEKLENMKSILGKEFIMAESEAYFNPYYHVLKALQRFDENNFPLVRYIVHVNTETEPPRYLNEQEIYTIQMAGNSLQFRVLNGIAWPTPEECGLDHSQYTAFRAALTNDLTVIQGPPGTGKTFLGLKIAQGLLANAHAWNNTNTPIFVVCFTNHALDQFLEGLLPFTTKLVRIGGKSKGSELDKFNIRERRKEYSYYKKIQGREIRDLKSKMSTVFADIQVHQTNLKALDDTIGILSLKTLQLVMSEEQRDYFANDDDLLDWLLVGVGSAKAEKKVKITITADRGVVREAPQVDPLVADAEDLRVKQAFFDVIDLDTAVGPSEDIVKVRFACDLDNIAEKQSDLLQKLNSNKKIHRSQLIYMRNMYDNLNMILTHLRTELVGSKKYPRSELEKENLFHHVYLRDLEPDARWRLYHTWFDILRNGLIVELGAKDTLYKDYSFRYEQLRQNDDLQILKTANVVGTTTTLAAKFQPMFTALAPKIVIVEEAAEVLEAHIIASLTRNCEHLILIGDHKQLRPSIAETRMARQYQLDVSLFERMVLNGMACHTLTLQHRMRPEISAQLVPTIYKVLRDDPSVQGRDNIRGMDKNVFFMTHTNFEDEVVEITSKRNRFEAEILLGLAKYLVKQGYKPEEITILATYKGQMYHMKNEISNIDGFPRGIQITVVDNFQGEENRIILLSLVRSNAINKIGFLEIENRICVALSRARDGLYIVGNMDCLVACSKIWRNIKNSLARQEAFGPSLKLRCQIHKEQITNITSAKDFSKVAEGGCSLLCGQLLPCGHSCKSMCHVEQDYHQRYKCKAPCSRILCAEGHQCPRKCHQKCEPCQIPMRRLLACQHYANVPCHMDSREFPCNELVQVVVPFCHHTITVPCQMKWQPECNLPCTIRLECGHSCEQPCHVNDDPDHLDYACVKPCARLFKNCSMDHKCNLECFEECPPCSQQVVRQLLCGHSLRLLCSADLATVVCQQKCKKTLDCGHPCTKKCFQQCQPCSVVVEKKVISCGHTMSLPCSTAATRQQCTGPCPNIMSCGHQCGKRCMDTCSAAECEQPVKVVEKKSVTDYFRRNQKRLFPMLCGHNEAYLPCNKKNMLYEMKPEELMQYCAKPCGEELTCKHVCAGTCSECMQGRIHKVCNEQCGNVLICGHSCKVPCRELCPPCKEPCRHECKHSKCSRKCGEECVPCKEPCDYQCEHMKCTRRCGELCNRDPCYEPCPRRLTCGHSCVGFCGEPCPPCRQCEPKHFEEFFCLGDETEEDAKWVLLVDCAHTLETTGLEMWLKMDQEGAEIGCKTCPRCKSPIVKTQRFMNLIKQTYLDIQNVKRQSFGKPEEIRKERAQALRKIQDILFEEMLAPNGSLDELKKLYNELKVELPEVKMKKRNTIDIQKAQLLCFLAEFFVSVYTRKQEVWSRLNDESKCSFAEKVNFITRLLMKRKHKISEQERQSFEREAQRIHRMADLLLYTSSPEYRMSSSNSEVESTRALAEKSLFSVVPYNKQLDDEIKLLLTKLKQQIRSSTEVSDAERAMINKAMSSNFSSVQKTGHWFKCKNGHIYCITECGGAMQEALCPVRGCGLRIGGANHRLRDDQSLASEMDGAKHGAWSDANNMANYRFF